MITSLLTHHILAPARGQERSKDEFAPFRPGIRGGGVSGQGVSLTPPGFDMNFNSDLDAIGHGSESSGNCFSKKKQHQPKS